MKIEIRDKEGTLSRMLEEMMQVLETPYKATLARTIISDRYYEMFPEKLEEKKRKIASES